MRPCSRCVAVADCSSAMRLAVDSVGSLWIGGSDRPPASCSRQHDRCRYDVGSGAVAAAATGCCTTALLTERLLRAVDDGVHRPSPPDTGPVGVWVAAPLVSLWSERMNAMWRSSL